MGLSAHSSVPSCICDPLSFPKPQEVPVFCMKANSDMLNRRQNSQSLDPVWGLCWPRPTLGLLPQTSGGPLSLLQPLCLHLPQSAAAISESTDPLGKEQGTRQPSAIPECWPSVGDHTGGRAQALQDSGARTGFFTSRVGYKSGWNFGHRTQNATILSLHQNTKPNFYSLRIKNK